MVNVASVSIAVSAIEKTPNQDSSYLSYQYEMEYRYAEDTPQKCGLQCGNAILPAQLPPPGHPTWAQEMGVSAAADSWCVPN